MSPIRPPDVLVPAEGVEVSPDVLVPAEGVKVLVFSANALSLGSTASSIRRAAADRSRSRMVRIAPSAAAHATGLPP